MVHGLLTAVASLVAEHGSGALGSRWLQHMCSAIVALRLWNTGSVVVAQGLSCSVDVVSSQTRDLTCVSCDGQEYSLQLSHQGRPSIFLKVSLSKKESIIVSCGPIFFPLVEMMVLCLALQ